MGDCVAVGGGVGVAAGGDAVAVGGVVVVSVEVGAVVDGARVAVGGTVGCAVISGGADTATVSLAAGDLVGTFVVHAETKTTLATRTKVLETRFLTVHSPPLELEDLS